MKLIAQYHDQAALPPIEALLKENGIPYEIRESGGELSTWDLYVEEDRAEDAYIIFEVIDENEERESVTCPSCGSTSMREIEGKVKRTLFSGTKQCYFCDECEAESIH
ncbi:MAG: DUF2007 domain-containing protein [Opitutales bacterium]|jgi:hypothetical protein|nr:DUF2007 domain-containing protein [Opitutales bacterium]MDP4644946.1 DUF2007 domain-containing protein [Opitutales bacterium]MDP4776765.1 DUF2007 domain-containing protein [Opitutales bacterium]MDP4882888.1 DUF2007 domain-containing protein [Opitutales bacterium]MDP5080403.1 DUF2007 domain-containing protein [Opitutales bacterium]